MNRGTARLESDGTMTDKNRQLLRVREVAETLSLSTRKVYQMIEEGTLPGAKIDGAVRIWSDAFEQWIEDKKGETEESRNSYGSKARLG